MISTQDSVSSVTGPHPNPQPRRYGGAHTAPLTQTVGRYGGRGGNEPTAWAVWMGVGYRRAVVCEGGTAGVVWGAGCTAGRGRVGG